MVGLYREDAVVLRTHRLGEADRIVVLMTARRGKVRAVAKGVRKTKSRFGARLEPPTNLRAMLYEGRQLDTITQVETIDPYRRVREDLDRTTDALALLEAVDQVAQEGEANIALYLMLTRALHALDEHRSPLLVASFYWKLLAVEGVAPVVDVCAGCGTPGVGTGVAAIAGAQEAAAATELVAYDPVAGGALCRSCRQGVGLVPGALDLIRRVFGGDLAGVLAEPAGPASGQVAELATTSLEHHLERRLRVVRLLGH